MISSDERCQRARMLMIAYEGISITAVGLLVVLLVFQIRQPQIPVYRQAFVFQHEILIPVETWVSHQISVRAISLETGLARETKFASPELGWVTDGARLWSISPGQLIESDGTTTTICRPQRLLREVIGRPFLFDSKPAVVECTETQAGGRLYQLLVYADGDWRETGRIATPGLRRTWTDDGPGKVSKLVSPVVKLPTSGAYAGKEQLWVIPFQGGYHLFQTDWNFDGHLAYRQGFDFVSSAENEPVSALAPENDTAECSGWKRLSKFEQGILQFGLSQQRVVILSGRVDLASPLSVLYWQTHDQAETAEMTFEEVTQVLEPSASVALLQSPDDAAVYIIMDQGVPGTTGQIFRFQAGRCELLPIQIECAANPVIWPLRRFVFAAWVLIVSSCCGFACMGTRLRAQSAETVVWRGHDCVQLATLNRRYLARSLDVLLIGSPLIAPLFQIVNAMDGDWLVLLLYRLPMMSPQSFIQPVQFVFSYLIVAAALWLALVVSQARFGLTPGKWLCGIRVLTTRLQRCGFSRSLLRDLFLGIDILEPGMVALLVSEKQQRLGDLYADTVVVDERSLQASLPRSDHNQLP